MVASTLTDDYSKHIHERIYYIHTYTYKHNIANNSVLPPNC